MKGFNGPKNDKKSNANEQIYYLYIWGDLTRFIDQINEFMKQERKTQNIWIQFNNFWPKPKN